MGVCAVSVLGGVMPPAAQAGSEDSIQKPAVFRVCDQVVTPRPEPFSFVALGPYNIFNHRSGFAYEPIAVRDLLVLTKVEGDGVWVSDSKPTKSLAAGALDGASFRVCRIENGKWRLVRKGKVPSGGHRVVEGKCSLQIPGGDKSQNAPVLQDDLLFVDQSLLQYDSAIWASTTEKEATSPPEGIPFLNTEKGHRWSLVPHPQPVPQEFSERGKTCLQLELQNADLIELTIGKFGEYQKWYEALEPGKLYRVEAWARAESLADNTLAVRVFTDAGKKILAQETWSVSDTWKRMSFDFRSPDPSPPAGNIKLLFKGPGKLWLDNVRFYEADTPYYAIRNAQKADLIYSAMGYWRDHSHVRTGPAYFMDELLNPPGVVGYRGLSRCDSPTTTPGLLNALKSIQMNPWFQVEVCMTDAEWLAWAEFMAAPYDPIKDTPQTKPYAYKRYQQGQPKPWVDEFDKMLVEIGNETWNNMFSPWVFMGKKLKDPVTGVEYKNGEIYGAFQEHIIHVFHSSPYWPRMANKMEFVIGGWSSLPDSKDNYGVQASRMSPSSQWHTLAYFNGGSEVAEKVLPIEDASFFKLLTGPVQVGTELATKSENMRKTMASEGVHYRLGLYESGPGYTFRFSPGKEAEEVKNQMITMKSNAAGVANLDAFLLFAATGHYAQQAFAQYVVGPRESIYSTHSRWDLSGKPYLCWKLCVLYNREGQGDFLQVETDSVPTWDLPSRRWHKAMPNASLIGVYATRNAQRYNLFVLSRKVDGYPVKEDDGFTPVTVRLPFQSVGKITLHKTTGNLRDNNIDTETGKIVTQDIPLSAFQSDFAINATTGSEPRGLPPASVFLYVFEAVAP